MNTISRVQHAWWCDRCGQHGPWYSPDDRTIRAGFAVHERNCVVPVPDEENHK